LRDLLVGELRDNAAARRHYITTASPFGIASMCVGLRDARDPQANNEHILWPQSDDEIELFLGRIDGVTQYSLSKSEWLSLLNAADILVPREHGRRRTRKGWWTVGSYKAELAGKRLVAFSTSREGRVLAAISHAFGKREVRKNNQRLSIDEWFELLEEYYECAPFCLPCARPEFLVEIVGTGVAHSAEQAVKWVSLVAPYEPRVVKQILGPSVLLQLEAHLSAKLEKLISEGEAFLGNYRYEEDEWEDGAHEEYAIWSNHVYDMLATATLFEQMFHLGIEEHVTKLSDLMDDTVAPPEPEEETESVRSVIHTGDWTIDRMFEDL
jgi:hypothetical protein